MTLIGDIDLVAQPELEEVLAAIRADEPADVEVDASAATFLSCGGLGFLSRLTNHLRDHGRRVRVVTSRPSVLAVLRLAKSDVALTVLDDTESEIRRRATMGGQH